MAVGSVGLKTAIWNNNLKSIALLCLFPVLLLAIAWAFFGATGGVQPDFFERANEGLAKYWPMVIGAATAWFLVAFAFHSSMINKATHAQSVTRKEYPRIYNLLENLCISRGIPMPKLQIIHHRAMNAFASGLTEKSYAITLTTGIIAELDDKELEAVIAHELSHIMNRDVRLLVISVVFVGIISTLAQWAWRSMWYSRWGGRGGFNHRGRSKNNMPALLIAMIILAVGYLFSQLIRFAISRKREYMADAGAVELTKNPGAMISALEKIAGRANIKEVPSDMKQMMIENSAKANIMGLFTTHPPITSRIEALKKFGGTPHISQKVKNPWAG